MSQLYPQDLPLVFWEATSPSFPQASDGYAPSPSTGVHRPVHRNTHRYTPYPQRTIHESYVAQSTSTTTNTAEHLYRSVSYTADGLGSGLDFAYAPAVGGQGPEYLAYPNPAQPNPNLIPPSYTFHYHEYNYHPGHSHVAAYEPGLWMGHQSQPLANSYSYPPSYIPHWNDMVWLQMHTDSAALGLLGTGDHLQPEAYPAPYDALGAQATNPSLVGTEQWDFQSADVHHPTEDLADVHRLAEDLVDVCGLTEDLAGNVQHSAPTSGSGEEVGAMIDDAGTTTRSRYRKYETRVCTRTELSGRAVLRNPVYRKSLEAHAVRLYQQAVECGIRCPDPNEGMFTLIDPKHAKVRQNTSLAC